MILETQANEEEFIISVCSAYQQKESIFTSLSRKQ